MTEHGEPLFAGADDDGKRIDRVLRRHFPGLALSGIHRLLRRGRVRVNRVKAAAGTRLKEGDRIDIAADLAALSLEAQRSRTEAPEAIRERLAALVLFRNEHVLALNKPYGALSHGPGSLDNLVVAATAGRSPSLSFRPGPAHRLDRNTTGVQLWSLSLPGARELARLFRTRLVSKVYCALVEGTVERADLWEDRLERDESRRVTAAARSGAQGLHAATRIVPVFPGKRRSLVFFLPSTGRTHQLRFQAARRGHPLPGDVKYGGAPDMPRYLLHNLGLAADSEALGLPALVAPFDEFGRLTIASHFGVSAVETIYKRCRDILAAGGEEDTHS